MGNRAFQRIMAGRTAHPAQRHADAVPLDRDREEQEPPIVALAPSAQAGDIPPDDSAPGAGQNTARRIEDYATGGPLRRQTSGAPAEGLVRRAPPSADERLNALEKRADIQEKKTKAILLDQHWAGEFGKLLADYHSAVYRITKALDAAGSGFQQAQVDQAVFEQLATQIIGAGLTIAFAAGFEWMFTKGAGLVGIGAAAAKMEIKASTSKGLTADKAAQAGQAAQAAKIKGVAEKVENPANTAAQAGVNVTAAGKASGAAESGQAPTPAGTATTPATASSGPIGSPMAFMAGNLDTLSQHQSGIQAAFSERATEIGVASDDSWDKFDPKAQGEVYKGLYDELKKAGKSADSLKDEAELAKVIERHIWAAWIVRQTVPDIVHGATIKGIGSFIEDRMNVIELPKRVGAGLVLTGHWYSSNEPSNWRQVMITWASGFQETISHK